MHGVEVVSFLEQNQAHRDVLVSSHKLVVHLVHVLENLEVAYTHSIRPEQFGRLLGLDSYLDYLELLNSIVDGVEFVIQHEVFVSVCHLFHFD